MSESKLPFKTNLEQPLVKGRGQATPAKGDGKKRSKSWGEPRKKIKGTQVDTRREKVERIKWLAKWIVIIPGCIYALSWVFLIFSDLFSS